MVSVKSTTTKKVELKDLVIENGQIVDVNGEIKDLNKIAKLVFNEGDEFKISFNTKTEDEELVEESETDED